MNKPLLSVITPVYNGEKYIAQTIESILAQDFTDFEYLLQDDGSHDNSYSIMKKYEKDSRIQIFRHPNIGQFQSDDIGIAMAKGKYFTIINADDPLYTTFTFRKLVEVMESKPEILVAYPDIVLIDARDNIIEEINTQDYSFKDMIRIHRCFPSAGSMYRREPVLGVGRHDYYYKYIGDYQYFLDIALLGPFLHLPMILATFRVHSAQLSTEKGYTMAIEHLKLMDKFFRKGNIPAEILSIKDEAYCWANLVAGAVCPNRLERLTFALKGVKRYPKLLLDAGNWGRVLGYMKKDW